MRIIVDAYGGDNAPLSVIEGAALAVEEFGVEVILTGKSNELKKIAKDKNISLEGISFIEAATIMPVEVEPKEIRSSEYADSSMAVALNALANDQADAMVSAGSTGAMVVGSTVWVKRIKGVRRPALGVLIPDSKGFHLLIDSGANSEARPEMLMQFGIMGSVYMEAIFGLESPRVGMVNIGTEANKGTSLQHEASAMLEKAPLNFIGNVESSQLPLHGCDVAVTDGFTGNIILKHTEGMAKFFVGELKDIFYSSFTSKLAALIVKKGIKNMAKKLDASEYGGVPLLGIRKPVIKAHGNSNAVAIKNAIRQAKRVYENNMIGRIEQALIDFKEEAQE